jgi:hypothetical protein
MLLHELMAQGNLKMFGLVPVLGLFITGAFAVASISNNALGTTDEDIVHKFGHAQNAARLQSRTNTYSMDRASLAKSWDGATIFTTGTR